jgi:hypothetical protein
MIFRYALTRALSRQGAVAGAEHRQTKHAWKRAVCASPCPQSVQIVARQQRAQQSCAVLGAVFAAQSLASVDNCAASKAAQVGVAQGLLAGWLSLDSPLTTPGLVEPLGRSDSARCDFVIGPARSTAAQACCAPMCDLRRGTACRGRQGDMSLSRPSHRESSRSSPHLHAATPLLLDLSCLPR